MIKDTPEGQTHYSCNVALEEGLGCCGCNNHDCIEAGAKGFLSQPENEEATAIVNQMNKQTPSCGYPNHGEDFCPALKSNCPLLKINKHE